MDRLDTWLSAQRGWRRFALLCLGLWPGAVLLGDLAVASVLNFSGHIPDPGSVLLAVVLSVPGTVPFTGLMLLLWSWSTRYARKRGKPGKRPLTWRLFLEMLLSVSGMTIMLLQITETYRWNQAHQELFPVFMLLLAASVLVMLWDYRYQRRISKRS